MYLGLFLAFLSLSFLAAFMIASDFEKLGYSLTGFATKPDLSTLKVVAGDKVTRAVLYNAKVSVYDSKGKFVASGDTGSRAAVFQVKAGTYTLYAKAPGYKDLKRTAFVKADSYSISYMDLEKSAVKPTATPTLSPKPVISTLNVVAGDKVTRAVLYNAKVSVYDSKGKFVASGDTGSGAAVFKLPGGTYTLYATAPGYKDFKRTTSVPANSVWTSYMGLEKSAVKPTATPTLSPKPVISTLSVVVDDKDMFDKGTFAVLYNAKVSVYDSKGKFVASGDTGSGAAVFKVPGGTYTLYATAPGYKDFKRTTSVPANSVWTSYMDLEKSSPNVAKAPASAASPKPGCTPSCTKIGQRQCYSNDSWQQCGNDTKTGCLKWFGPYYCGSNQVCSYGSCKSTPKPSDPFVITYSPKPTKIPTPKPSDPFDICYQPEITRFSMTPPYPQPAQSYVTFDLGGNCIQKVRLQISDSSGRIVFDSGEKVVKNSFYYSWNLKGKNGKRVAAGTYFYKVVVKVKSKSVTRSGKIVVAP
ncbi:MAG: hypothetical protein HYX24_00705 [Candidatus Aenigmarchaeota archaeon]|nr:hypothetical protein [Candidatus Aenigmarchaeota archaeon]